MTQKKINLIRERLEDGLFNGRAFELEQQGVETIGIPVCLEMIPDLLPVINFNERKPEETIAYLIGLQQTLEGAGNTTCIVYKEIPVLISMIRKGIIRTEKDFTSTACYLKSLQGKQNENTYVSDSNRTQESVPVEVPYRY